MAPPPGLSLHPVPPVASKTAKQKGSRRIRFADEEGDGQLVDVVDIEPITLKTAPDAWMRWTSYNWICHEIGEGVEQPEEPSDLPSTPQSPASFGVPCVPKGCTLGSSKCFSDGPNDVRETVEETVPAHDVRADSKEDVDSDSKEEYHEEEQQLVGCEESLVSAAQGQRMPLFTLATSHEGCIAVRRVLQEARQSVKEQSAIAAEFHGHVKDLVASPQGCEVLQSCVEMLKPTDSHFVAAELTGVASTVARSPAGYLVMCRVLEHLPAAGILPMIEELLAESASLCRHHRANIVVQHVFEHGLFEHRMHIAKVLAADLECIGRHRSGSHVVEKVLLSPDPAPRAVIVETAVQAPDILVSLACNRQSKFVIQHFLKIPGRYGEMVRSALIATESQLRSSKYGSHVADALAANIPSASSE